MINNPKLLSLSFQERSFTPLIICVALLWTHLSWPKSVVCWGHWSTGGGVLQEQSEGRELSLSTSWLHWLWYSSRHGWFSVLQLHISGWVQFSNPSIPVILFLQACCQKLMMKVLPQKFKKFSWSIFVPSYGMAYISFDWENRTAVHCCGFCVFFEWM